MSWGFWGVALVALYLLWTGTLAVMAPRLIYPFAQTPFRDPAFTMRDVAAGDGLTLAVAVAPGAPDRPVILFFMGNYGARAGFAAFSSRSCRPASGWSPCPIAAARVWPARLRKPH
ncbi:MAG: hypothetical protein JKP98_10630 [Rhodobacteraceae bacterium]|nr:hypothetical protein [Paracoccaceae bacterium]